tara:strand:- start:208 stop:591 length:384 start_codon:yes stop_codon:yes gene_type:complete
MYIEFRNTKKKRQRTIEDALWFAKSYLLPRHKIDEIDIESWKNLPHDGDCYDVDDRSFIIRVNKDLSKKDLLATIFHEFVHIKQHIKKEFGDDVFGISNEEVAYMDRPYEIEAFKLERKMFDNYIKK